MARLAYLIGRQAILSPANSCQLIRVIAYCGLIVVSYNLLLILPREANTVYRERHGLSIAEVTAVKNVTTACVFVFSLSE